jgi:hypothetical protein
MLSQAAPEPGRADGLHYGVFQTVLSSRTETVRDPAGRDADATNLRSRLFKRLTIPPPGSEQSFSTVPSAFH